MITKFVKGEPIFVDDIGKEIYNDSKVTISRVYLNNRIPVHVVYSETIKNVFRRESYGEEKVENLTRSACQAVRFLKDEINLDINKKNMNFLWLCLFFGGRAFNMKEVFRNEINPNYDLPVLGLKPERVTSHTQESWDIHFWGAIPECKWDYNKLWWPISDEQKKNIIEEKHENLKLFNIPETFQEYRQRFDCIDNLIVPDGAYATGKSSTYSLAKTYEILKYYGFELPTKSTMIGAYVSSRAIETFYNASISKNMQPTIIVFGGISEMSKKGIFPYLDDTDLPLVTEECIVYRDLYEFLRDRCINKKGELCKVCTCGDVGTSLDDPIIYKCEFATELLMWDISFSKYGINNLLENENFILLLKKYIKDIQKSKNIRLVDVNGTYILDKLNGKIKKTYQYIY